MCRRNGPSIGFSPAGNISNCWGPCITCTKDEAAKRIAELLKLVELEAHADRPAKTYSGGMKRKLDIACGLLPDPKILFLDEPTLGLDVQSRLRIWDYVRHVEERAA